MAGRSIGGNDVNEGNCDRVVSARRTCQTEPADSTGVAHTWARWLELLGSGQDWDLYCATVVLVGDDDHFYSCGMHHFGLAECAVPRTLGPAEAADLMNRFNLWRIAEDPVFESGHTFSLDADAPRWRLALAEDTRHAADEGFHNPEGVWVLGAA